MKIWHPMILRHPVRGDIFVLPGISHIHVTQRICDMHVQGGKDKESTIFGYCLCKVVCFYVTHVSCAYTLQHRASVAEEYLTYM